MPGEIAQFVTGLSPVPVLTSPATLELGLPSSRKLTAMTLSPARRSDVAVLRRSAASHHSGYW